MNYYSVVILALLNLKSCLCFTVQSHAVCDGETFRATCDRGQVVVITKAVYGHIEVGRCIEFPTERLGCKADVLDIISGRCDGKIECEVAEDDPEIKALQPCSRGIYMYLDVSFVCVPAKPAKVCQPIKVTNDKTFISTKQTGACPGVPAMGGSQYLLTTAAGKRIKISSICFPSDEVVEEFVEVGYLLDEGTEEITPLSVRPDGGRERVLMTSDSNRATLSIHQGANINFLVFLTAIGCEDMQQPKDMWLDRDQDELTVGCLNSRKSWSLRCEGVHWRGVIGNCTEESSIAVAEIKIIEEITMALPRDVVLMIIFSMTAVIALIIVTSGYVSYKRSALTLAVPQPELALLHNDIEQKPSASNANRGSVPSAPQGPQYTLMKLHENPSQQHPPPVPPRKDNYSAQTTLNLRDNSN